MPRASPQARKSGSSSTGSHLGLQGDYFTLAKSLGGGIAKAALTLIRGSRYRTDFELVHSSTCAKDSFSTLMAGRAVDLLEADGGGRTDWPRNAATNCWRCSARCGRSSVTSSRTSAARA